jgi:hypothetical protein
MSDKAYFKIRRDKGTSYCQSNPSRGFNSYKHMHTEHQQFRKANTAGHKLTTDPQHSTMVT